MVREAANLQFDSEGGIIAFFAGIVYNNISE